MVTPLTVQFDEDTQYWMIRVGRKGEILEDKHGTKNSAKEEAVRLAEMQDRPGTVVYNRDGSYWGFRENTRYWSNATWEYE